MDWSCLVSIPLCLLALIPTILSAQEIDEIPLPSLELIEFLGAFEDDDAGWIDPLELLAMDDEFTDVQNRENENDH